jgi:hypothetical protein
MDAIGGACSMITQGEEHLAKRQAGPQRFN